MIIPSFENKAELFQYLKAEKTKIMDFKKSAIKFTDGIISNIESGGVNKSVNKNDLTPGLTTIVANTYNWMDSHDDVHLDKVFSKSIKDRKDRVFHLHDHDFKLVAQVGDIQDIEERAIPWRTLGVDKDGDTVSLIIESDIKESYNPFIFNQYNKGAINQHSVGMYYVSLKMAINSDGKEYAQEKAEWDKHIDSIGNKDRAIERGYFFAIYEAKLIEVSAVLQGSNELTPTLQDIEPSADTQKTEPPAGTQIDLNKVIEIIKNKTNDTRRTNS